MDNNNFTGLIELIKTAQGNRSLNQFAFHCGISAGHLSRILNGKFQTPPTPKLLKKIGDHAYNDITFDHLMEAAGYYMESNKFNWCVMENNPAKQAIIFTEKETSLIKQIQSTPELQSLVNDLVDAPTHKIKLLAKIWKAIRED